MEGMWAKLVEREVDRGRCNSDQLARLASSHFLAETPQWTVHKRITPFDRRITALAWHPTLLDVVAVGSHGGDILQWNVGGDASRNVFLPGCGPGGSITEMKFSPSDPQYIYTTSVDGTFALKDLEGKHSQTFLDTMDYRYWYCTFALSPGNQSVMFAGQNTGDGFLLAKDGNKIWHHRLHKQKIQHSEFVPSAPHLLLTASNDRTIRVWDLRHVSKTKPTPVITYETSAAVNSAYFDPHYGSLLLVTCQNSQLLVFNVNLCSTLPLASFQHHHKFFQHLTPIKATWHPLYPNLVVVGRYMGAEEDGMNDRFVDVVDWERGETVGRLRDMSAKGIVTLNQFNKVGDLMASGMGYNALIWKRVSRTVVSDHGDQVASALRQRKEQNRQRRSRMEGREKRAKMESSKGVCGKHCSTKQSHRAKR